MKSSKENAMHDYVVFLALPEASAAVGERLLRSAVSFLENRGATRRSDLGTFHRLVGKGKTLEVARLSAMQVDVGSPDTTLARSLEVVLRSGATAAGLTPGSFDARVFLPSTDESSSE